MPPPKLQKPAFEPAAWLTWPRLGLSAWAFALIAVGLGTATGAPVALSFAAAVVLILLGFLLFSLELISGVGRASRIRPNWVAAVPIAVALIAGLPPLIATLHDSPSANRVICEREPGGWAPAPNARPDRSR